MVMVSERCNERSGYTDPQGAIMDNLFVALCVLLAIILLAAGRRDALGWTALGLALLGLLETLRVHVLR